MMQDTLSPRIYEIIIAVVISCLCFFLKRLVDSVDKLAEKVEKINLTLVSQYASKEEVTQQMEDLELTMTDKIKMCELRHHRLKEAS